MFNHLNSLALVYGLFISLVFFFLGLLVAATTMGQIQTVVTLSLLQAVGSMGLLRISGQMDLQKPVDLVGIGTADRWAQMGNKQA